MLLAEANQKLEKMSEKLLSALKKQGIEKFFKDGDAIKKHLHLKQNDIDELIEESYGYCRRKEWQHAAEALCYLIFFEPARVLHFLRLAAIFMQTGKFEEALQILQMAAVLTPDDPTIYLYAGECHLELKRFNEAKKAFKACVELSHDLPERKEVYKLAKEALKEIQHF